MTLAGYVCWKPESLDLIETVAEDASRAMFIATHRSVRALQTQVGRDGEAHPANEHDVLNLLESERSDPLIIPIIGASGSGKSHLVRWLEFHLRTSERRHVIYVPRERTSLADVVELILERIPKGHEDADLDHEVAELQASLRRASREMSEIELRRRLVENIAHCVLRLDPTKSPYTSRNEAEGWRFLVGKTGLPVLLGDPLYKDALTADGGVIARLAARIAHGRAGDTSGEEPLFEFDDLIVDLPNAGLMNRLARDAHDRFKRPNQRWLTDIACDVLNHTLEDVAQETMGLSDNLGRPRISTIMIAVRRVLARRGMELVLLVEDLAVLHGIQRQLLEALITPRRKESSGEDSGGGELCQIRAAIAVTTGVWRQLEQSIDTLTRRLESWDTPVFNLDVPAEADPADAQYAREFVAGYLNAIRLGQDGLDSALRTFEQTPDEREYAAPSACAPCEYRSECHAGFADVEGRGLYPLNDEAVRRFVDVEARRSDGRFDPRRIVQGIRKMLDLASPELAAGGFPGGDVREYFVDGETAMSAPLSARLSRADPETGERRRTLLEFWGPRPYRIRNLDPIIHRAFKLPPLADDLLADDGEGPEDVNIDPETPTSRESAAQHVFEEFEKWGRGESTFADRVAQRLREWVFEAVLAQVEWESLSEGRSEELLREIGVPDASRCVSIDGARGDTRSGVAGTAVFALERSETNVRLLRGLAQLNGQRSWTFEDGEDGMLVVGDVTAPWVADVEARLRAREREPGAIDPGYLAGILAVTGMILGLDKPLEPSDSVVRALSLALTPSDSSIASGPSRSEEWTRLRGAAAAPGGKEIREEARRALLRRLGRTQGRGESIVAVDIADVVDALRQVCVEWRPPNASPNEGTEYTKWREAIAKNLTGAVDAETKRLSDWSTRVIANIDLQANDAVETATVEIEAVLGEIARLGKGASSDAFVRHALQEAQRVDDDEFRELVRFYQQDPRVVPWPQLLARAARDWSNVTAPVDELIRHTNSYFDVIERSLGATVGEGNGTRPIAKASESITTGLDELKRSLGISRGCPDRRGTSTAVFGLTVRR